MHQRVESPPAPLIETPASEGSRVLVGAVDMRVSARHLHDVDCRVNSAGIDPDWTRRDADRRT